ncbi:MAG TPA: hypothetical protein PKO28_01205 [Bacilli bacterium]|nr:hypothetical protein [Bacilli bacterium]HPS18544.1 hypothetical protein [Bacilli bacterium]
MLIIECFGHNIYISKELVGYIGENELFIKGSKFASITDYGVISIQNREVGFIDDDGSIIINGKEVGFIDGENNFVFFKLPIKND